MGQKAEKPGARRRRPVHSPSPAARGGRSISSSSSSSSSESSSDDEDEDEDEDGETSLGALGQWMALLVLLFIALLVREHLTAWLLG
eukprot:COSAG04_NODE_4686_length_1948_cov_13.827064_4_plen_87_part_00